MLLAGAQVRLEELGLDRRSAQQGEPAAIQTGESNRALMKGTGEAGAGNVPGVSHVSKDLYCLFRV